MEDRGNTAELEPARMDFPTDRITVAQMRRKEPDLFRHKALMTQSADAINALATHCWEQFLAEKAFASALSLTDPHPNAPREEIIDALDDGYRAYGLSGGMHETRQLARDIESAATKLAQERGGKPR